MEIVKAGYEILTSLDSSSILKFIEGVARVCYKSEDKITDDSAEKMVKALVKRHHEAMLEHFSFSVKFIVDRGVSHELVRHRIASFAQESTRYCNYSKEGFGSSIKVIEPLFFEPGSPEYDIWFNGCLDAERAYMKLLELGATPQEARSVLPNSLKTEIVMTMNLREWRHFFKLRALGVTGAPHPQMVEVSVPLLREVQKAIPIIFDDLVEEMDKNE